MWSLFFVLSIIMYVKYAASQELKVGNQKSAGGGNASTARKNPFTQKHYLLALGFFLLVLMSKPMAVTLPMVLLILDWSPLNRIQSLKTLWNAGAEKVPFLVFSLLSSVVTILAQQSGGAMKVMSLIPLSTRILVAVQSLVTYLGKMLLPLNFIPFYPYPKEASLYSLKYASAIILAVGITVACMVIVKRQKVWLLA